MARGRNRHPLKILHIDPERNWGGGERQVLGLLTYLSRNGHRNHLLCHPRGLLFEESRKSGIETFPLAVRNDLDLRPVRALRKMICGENYHIVHLHTKRAHVLSMWMPRSGARPKYVVTRRMDYPEKGNWYTRHLYNRCADGVVAISQRIADLLAEAGVQSSKIRVIHSGIDPRPFQKPRRESGLAANRLVIGTVAVLEERKGHRFLLEAAAMLKKQGRRLTYRFAGEGSQRSRLEALAAKLGLNDDVEFAGFVADIPDFLAAIDIFVLPSLYEGLGVAALEAMAAGKAVVASKVGGLAELVIDSATGFLVPPGDAAAVAGAIANLAEKRQLAEAMGNRAARRVEKHFTLELMTEKNEACYYELLGESGPEPLEGR